jgi:serine/threonine protein kinase
MVKNLRYDTRADLWCMGVLMVEMLFGTLPFKQNAKTKEYAESITSLKFTLPETKPGQRPVSREARDLI